MLLTSTKSRTVRTTINRNFANQATETAIFLIILLLIPRHVLLSRNAMRLALDRGLIIHRSRATVKLLDVCISMLGLVTLSTAPLRAGISYDAECKQAAKQPHAEAGRLKLRSALARR